MNPRRQVRFLLREAEMYLQFLTEDLDAIESIGEKSTSQLADVLSEVTGKLREAVNVFQLKITREQK
ncbi:MAG: hypothetical protein ACFFCW_21720 [Candidatus Hodarchaeota archaeon]